MFSSTSKSAILFSKLNFCFKCIELDTLKNKQFIWASCRNEVIFYIQFISRGFSKIRFWGHISTWGAFIKDTQKEVETNDPEFVRPLRIYGLLPDDYWKWKIHEEFWMGISSMASIRWIINISPSSSLVEYYSLPSWRFRAKYSML